MKAVRFHSSVPRYLSSKVLGVFTRKAYYGGFSALTYEEVPEPTRPTEDWASVKTAFCGICRSDLMAIFLEGNLDSPLYPFISFPMILGHEIVGEVAEVSRNVEGLAPGDRVVIDPLLPCKTRDIFPPCHACQEGRYSLCENFAEGSLPPGFILGTNRRTGGGGPHSSRPIKPSASRSPRGSPSRKRSWSSPSPFPSTPFSPIRPGLATWCWSWAAEPSAWAPSRA